MHYKTERTRFQSFFMCCCKNVWFAGSNYWNRMRICSALSTQYRHAVERLHLQSGRCEWESEIWGRRGHLIRAAPFFTVEIIGSSMLLVSLLSVQQCKVNFWQWFLSTKSWFCPTIYAAKGAGDLQVFRPLVLMLLINLWQIPTRVTNAAAILHHRFNCLAVWFYYWVKHDGCFLRSAVFT